MTKEFESKIILITKYKLDSVFLSKTKYFIILRANSSR